MNRLSYEKKDGSAIVEVKDNFHNKMKRRKFIKLTIVSSVGLLTTLIATRSFNNGVFSTGKGKPYELWRKWQELPENLKIVAAGVLAANPHNTQPWFFHITDQWIDVISDPSRRMPLIDASHREHFAGLGCAVENMRLAARASGKDVNITLLPQGSDSNNIARLELKSGSIDEDEIYPAIGLRRSNRGAFSNELISEDLIKNLTSQASKFDGLNILWLTSSIKKSQLSELIVSATQAIIDDIPQSIEAVNWFRNNRSEIDKFSDGLTLDGQNFNMLTLALAKILPSQSRTSSDAFWLKRVATVQTATAAAYGIIVTDNAFDRKQQIIAGQLLQRLHLAATTHGLGFQHMNQITERIDRDNSIGNPDQFSTKYSELLGVPASKAIFAFRLGYPERIPLFSPRRSLTDVVV